MNIALQTTYSLRKAISGALLSQEGKLTESIQHHTGTIDQLRLELEMAKENAIQECDTAERIRGNLAKTEVRLESVV